MKSAVGRSVLRYWAVLLFVAVAGVVAINHPYDNEPSIRSDGLGYHAWTRVLLDRHLSFCEYPILREVGATRRDPSTGRCPNKYPPGLAVLRFPVMGPITALNDGVLRSSAEDIANEVLSVLAGAIAVAGTVFTARSLGVRSWIANASAVAVTFGTGLFHYSTYDSSFTHAYSAALVALLLAFGARRLVATRDDAARIFASRWLDGSVVFVLCLLLFAIRLPSLLLVAAMAVLAIEITRSGRSGLRPRVLAMLAGAGAAAGVVVAGQVAYNYALRETLTLSSYSGEEFLIGRLKQLDVFMSLQKGFVTWYPVVIVVVVAALLARNWTGLAFLGGITIPLVVLYGAWHDWQLGGGFGHRGFVELAPAYGLVLALSLERLGSRLRIATVAVAFVAVVMTLGLLAAYWNGDVSFYGADADEWVRYTVGERAFPVVISDWVTGS